MFSDGFLIQMLFAWLRSFALNIIAIAETLKQDAWANRIEAQAQHKYRTKVSSRAAFDAANSIAYSDSSHPICNPPKSTNNALTSRPNPTATQIAAPAVHDTKHTEPSGSSRLIYNNKPNQTKIPYPHSLPFPTQC